ncbi:SHOCT-like domain-containing protein [Scopulibacillus cellulosilyticus]|uniref:YvlB/LiaX N-terminal domain-containing protein n=1 Tax=Scopulibacillus cellulosilyticus TaxID=2665665 RepID=A0ABW2Q2W3_9BACL
MKEEITKVLTMVQEGKLDSDEASELIQALKIKGSTSAAIKGSNYLDKMLKVRVMSEEGDKVNVNLPLRLIKVALKTGLSIATAIPESAKYVKDIDVLDVDLILKAIENELSGQIVDVESKKGEKVSVVIE